jgi:hypothetical protein
MRVVHALIQTPVVTRLVRMMLVLSLLGCIIQSLAVLVFAVAVSPAQIESGEVRVTAPCPSLTHLGVPCRYCGVTRGITAFFHNGPFASFKYNKLAPILVLMELVLLFAASSVLLRIARDE